MSQQVWGPTGRGALGIRLHRRWPRRPVGRDGRGRRPGRRRSRPGSSGCRRDGIHPERRRTGRGRSLGPRIALRRSRLPESGQTNMPSSTTWAVPSHQQTWRITCCTWSPNFPEGRHGAGSQSQPTWASPTPSIGRRHRTDVTPFTLVAFAGLDRNRRLGYYPWTSLPGGRLAELDVPSE